MDAVDARLRNVEWDIFLIYSQGLQVEKAVELASLWAEFDGLASVVDDG